MYYYTKQERDNAYFSVTPYNFFMNIFNPERLNQSRFEQQQPKPVQAEGIGVDRRATSLKELSLKSGLFSSQDNQSRQQTLIEREAHTLAYDTWCKETLKFQLAQLDKNSPHMACIPATKQQCEDLHMDTRQSNLSDEQAVNRSGLPKRYTAWINSRCIVLQAEDTAELCSSLSNSSCMRNYEMKECQQDCSMYDYMTNKDTVGFEFGASKRDNDFKTAYEQAQKNDPNKEKLKNPFTYPETFLRFIKSNDFDSKYPGVTKGFERCRACKKRVEEEVGLEDCYSFVLGADAGGESQVVLDTLQKFKFNDCQKRNSVKKMQFRGCERFNDAFEVILPNVDCDDTGNCYAEEGSYFNCRITKEYCDKFDLLFDPMKNGAGRCLETGEVAKVFENLVGQEVVRKRIMIDQDIDKYCSKSSSFHNVAMCALRHVQYVNPGWALTEAIITDAKSVAEDSWNYFFNDDTQCPDIGPVLYRNAMNGVGMQDSQLPESWRGLDEATIKNKCVKCLKSLYSINPVYAVGDTVVKMMTMLLGIPFPEQVNRLSEEDMGAISRTLYVVAAAKVPVVGPILALVVMVGPSVMSAVFNMEDQYKVSFVKFFNQQVEGVSSLGDAFYENWNEFRVFWEDQEKVKNVGNVLTAILKCGNRAAKFLFNAAVDTAKAAVEILLLINNVGMYPVNKLLLEFERWSTDVKKWDFGWILLIGLYPAMGMLKFLQALDGVIIGVLSFAVDVAVALKAVGDVVFDALEDIVCLFGILC